MLPSYHAPSGGREKGTVGKTAKGMAGTAIFEIWGASLGVARSAIGAIDMIKHVVKPIPSVLRGKISWKETINNDERFLKFFEGRTGRQYIQSEGRWRSYTDYFAEASREWILNNQKLTPHLADIPYVARVISDVLAGDVQIQAANPRGQQRLNELILSLRENVQLYALMEINNATYLAAKNYYDASPNFNLNIFLNKAQRFAAESLTAFLAVAALGPLGTPIVSFVGRTISNRQQLPVPMWAANGSELVKLPLVEDPFPTVLATVASQINQIMNLTHLEDLTTAAARSEGNFVPVPKIRIDTDSRKRALGDALIASLHKKGDSNGYLYANMTQTLFFFSSAYAEMKGWRAGWWSTIFSGRRGRK